MDQGQIVMSGLKDDMSGGVFLMKAESIEVVEAYLENEPLRVHGVQEYRMIPFEPHFISDKIKD